MNNSELKKLAKVKSYWEKQLNDVVSLGSGEELYFLKMLEIAKKSSKILEIGVGKGRMVKLLRQNGVDADFYGLDITYNVKNSETIGVIGDARMLPFSDGIFDLVYSLGVVEHFPETHLAILEHYRTVKKGGHVLITTPHLSIFTPLRYLVYFLKDRQKGSFEEIRGRNISLNTMLKYFTDANLSIEDYGVCGFFGINKLSRKFNLAKLEQNIFIGAHLYIIAKKY